MYSFCLALFSTDMWHSHIYIHFWGAACEVSCCITWLSKRWDLPVFPITVPILPPIFSFQGQKQQMIMHQCEGSGSLSGSRAFPTSTLPVLCILLSSLMALQSPGWTVLNVLSSSVSRSILTTKCTLWLMMMVSKYEVILYSCQRPSCSFLLLACPRTPAKCCHPSACPSEQRQAVFQCWPWTSFDWGWKRCWMLF